MKLLFRVSLGSLLVFIVLLKSSQAQCVPDCESQTPTNITVTTTEISTSPNCNLSVGNQFSGGPVISDLTPGTVYQIFFTCFNCCKQVTTRPYNVSELRATGISTDSVTLVWEQQEIKSDYSYVVEVTNGSSSFQYEVVTNTTCTVTGLLSGTNYSFTVTTQTPDGTKAAPVTESYFTRPYSVTELKAFTLNTTAVYLNWTKPLQHKDDYKYRIETSQCDSQNKTVADEFTVISDLNPGTSCTFCVFVNALDGTEGQSDCTSQYTKPGAVSDLVMSGTTTTMSVSWSLAAGQVDSYDVFLYTNDQPLKNQTDLSNTTKNKEFQYLKPGQLYSVYVVTKSGPLAANSTVSNATFPNPPGPITVTSQTPQSINFTWAFPEDMDNDQYNFTVFSLPNQHLTKNNWFLLKDLQSGTPYQISVWVVAVLEYQSTNVMTTNYTRPYNVSELRATGISTDSVTLVWEQQEIKSDYSYVVEVTNGSSSFQYEVVTNTTCTVTGLLSGTNYSFTVTTQTPDGTKAAPVTESYFTRPYSVTELKAFTLNTTAVYLNWTKPLQHKDDYKYRIETSQCDSQNKTVADEFTVISDLNPGTSCTFCVFVNALDGTEGQSDCTSQYTKPGAVSDLVMSGTTTTMSVSWSLAAGQVDSYDVFLYTNDQPLKNQTDLSNTTKNKEFQYLKPGQLYSVYVVTKSGPLAANSTVSNATFPNPPGPITVTSQTPQSINFTWAFPEDMDNDQYNFTVFSLPNQHLTKNNWFLLKDLQSGTPYQISVWVVAVLEYQSTNVMTTNYTRPYNVSELRATGISTDYVTLVWEQQEIKSDYSYVVEVTNGSSSFQYEVVTNTTCTVTGLLSGTNYSFTVTTQTPDGTKAAPVTESCFTRPYGVIELKAFTLNTTAVYLNWTNPLQHKDDYKYRIETSQCDSQNKTVEDEFTVISDLNPGTNCTFCVFVSALDGSEGQANCTSQYTKPGAVSDLVMSGTTTTMSVSWSLAAGQVDSYDVFLYTNDQLLKNQTDLSNTTKNKEFQYLKPGQLYSVYVVTKSGPLTANSTISNATFPNPPRPITVTSQTPQSINFTWAFPEDMDNDQYNFTVFSLENEHLTKNNWFLLKDLQSGTPYEISVWVVAALEYQSTNVMTTNYTRPYNVSELKAAEISTDNVTLVWEQQEIKSDYTYVVEVTNGSSSFQYEVVTNTTCTVTGLLSGTNYSFTVTTQTPDGTKAAPVTESCFTRPYSVTELKAFTLNTTAVYLNWTKPLQHKDDYKYRIKTSQCDSQNKTVADEFTVISGLNPGTNCTFCVFVSALDGTEGQPNCTSQYTKPEAVKPRVTSDGSNHSVVVSWTHPMGNVEHYVILLNGTSVTFPPQNLNSNATSFLFKNLSAGSLYSVVVYTVSVPFSVPSEVITNATFPNPPGPIEILFKTTSSLSIRWDEAPLMTDTSFHYLVTIIPSQGPINTTNTTSTSHNFTSLLSGTSYNLSVVTVGPLGFKSHEVETYMVTTRPNSVKPIITSTQEDSITLTWVQPNDYKEGYRYSLIWLNSSGSIIGKDTLVGNERKISNLVPGSSYNFSVTTETSDGTQGASKWISNCTNASPVPGLKCQIPAEGNASLILSWNKTRGLNSGFNITAVNNDTSITQLANACNQLCSHTVSNLSYYTEYTLTVVTLSCGQPSTPVSHSCRTGISKPPIPPNSGSLMDVAEKAHDRFTIQIKPSLLDARNGPITNIGVLVTNNIHGVSTSHFKQYLVKTHQEWTDGMADAYLATVTENGFQSRSGVSQFTIVIGDSKKWKGYTNGALKSKETYWYAVVLFTELKLKNGLVDADLSLVSITEFFSVALPPNYALIGAAVGATLGIFCFLFVILIGFIIYLKRFSKKESADIQINSLKSKVSLAVKVEEYEAYYKRQKANSNCGFAEEFEELKVVGTVQSKTHAMAMENKPKNRYNNVLPYDSSRVKLSIIHGSPYDDYINANYIPGYNSRKEFIAAQGPLPSTVKDFWRMIWEKNIQTLVMLTGCIEQGRAKCDQYWDYGTKHFENITVTTVSEIPLEDWTIRDFNIKNLKTAETRSVRQFHFTAWPDHGVPDTTELIISFRHLVRQHMDQFSTHAPTVVHCSAGVGRTGTFISIDRLCFQIERENVVDVFGIVHDQRMHRPLMVQTEDQYVFLNQCALDIIRSRTGTNVDLIYQNMGAFAIYENVEPKKGFHKNGYPNT
ncbi:receptor-type tyrosine-protein phosphatase eta isoform X2 [Thalassophryne amazonica]|uniref:receptor-type tyrosine-protein phosphatase eta isoform X2 n=1 Tax=Thalassophryne amazonica TaxID=390379 RepID=UPI0014722F44|nr:receptor-type tyrosine-protein phosphatase eta isoform X2 [Thalassophryne amazonica]